MGTSRSSRFSLDPGVEVTLGELAAQAHVSLPALAAVLSDMATQDVRVSQRAQIVLTAWRSGTAQSWQALQLPATDAAALTVSLGRFVPEEPGSVPFTRDGFGCPAGWIFNDQTVIASTRGVWAARLPKEGAWIVAQSYGSIPCVIWGKEWQRTEGGRVWASKVLIPDHQTQTWMSENNRPAGPINDADRAFIIAARDLVVYPPATQNPVSWLKKDGTR